MNPTAEVGRALRKVCLSILLTYGYPPYAVPNEPELVRGNLHILVPMAPRLDGYIRVSRVGGREGEGYISPDVQRESIESYARELGGKIVAWHDDQNRSGGNTERPGFQAALERIRSGDSDGIVVMRIDRFARSVADGAAIVREIVDGGRLFASCHERIDPSTPEGKFMLTSFLANAELFLDQAKASWSTAKTRAVARGVHIGPTPFGYLRKKSQPLEPHPAYGLAMSRLFERASTGRHGDTALARWMTERVPRESGAPWNPSEIRRWLSSRVYLGEVRYGDLVKAEAHDPLTDQKTWDACQREPGERKMGEGPFLLRGLIRCAACRYAMGGQTNGGADGQTRVYRCPRSNRGCPEPSVIVAGRIEGLVVGLVEAHQAGLIIGEADRSAEDAADIESFDRAALEVEKFVSDTEARSLMGDGPWNEGLRLRVEAREERCPARDAALARIRARSITRRSLQEVDLHELGDMLRGMIQHVFIRRGRRGVGADERTLIIWADDVRPIDVPGPHCSGPFEPIRW